MRILKIFANFFLVVIAVLLFTILSVVGFFWSFYLMFYKKSIGVGLDSLSQYLHAIALSIDQFGNVAFAGMLNDVLIDKTLIKLAHFHGDPDETVSEVLGWNKMTGALSKTGNKLVNILNKLDKNHCENAAQTAYEKSLEKLNRYTHIIEINE
jgi:hypothetical protein